MADDAALYAWKEQVRKEYLDERRDANDKYFKQASQLSKLILTISAGALALSFGYLKDNADNILLLKWLWAFLAATVIFGFTSASFSLMALKRGRDLVDDYYSRLLQENPYNGIKIKYKLNIWNYFLAVSNVFVFIVFLGSFILTAIFYIVHKT